MNPEEAEIDALVGRFFRAFDNTGGVAPDLDSLRELFVADALICKNVGGAPEFFGVEAFIEPRRKLLSDGTLIEFREWELQSCTDIVGAIAQRLCLYEKSGTLDGKPFRTRGVKTLQLLRTPVGWRIGAVAWDDEREGFEIDLSRFPSD